MPASDLLSTKLLVPPIRQDRVLRPRLADRLNAGLDKKLTLISAPAGYGKTLLASEWATALRAADPASPVRAVWVSLDAEDSAPARFLTYLIAAIRTAEPDFARGALSALRSPEHESIQQSLTRIINELTEFDPPVLMILDDFHVIESTDIDELLVFVLDNQPPPLHLVILTREDPALPIARLRAQGELSELRAADLRFNSPESGDFLNRVMGLSLSPASVEALEERTEGWIAGLQLAAISMRGKSDPEARVRSFAGSHRFVLDYLVEEVLQQQPERVQTFLLETSILRQLSGSLCSALTGQEDSLRALEQLDQANLFLVPLDEERQWYRYHHLFADLLSDRLQSIRPESLPSLHLKASLWYEANGFTSEAIRHALSAGEPERAASLAEDAWPEMHMSYQGMTWLRWVESIPDSVVRASPVLSMGVGWSLIDRGDLEEAEVRLQDAERCLQVVSKPGKGALSSRRRRALAGSIANARAYLTQASGDVEGTVKYSEQALSLLAEDDHFERGLSSILPGFAYWSRGDMSSAYQAISDALDHMRIVGRLPFIVSFTTYLADILMAQGRLREAQQSYRRLLLTARVRGYAELPELSVVHFGLSDTCLERGDLGGARRQLHLGEVLGELPSFPPWYRHWLLARTQLLQRDGDLDQVFRILDEAQGLYNRHPIPDVRPLWALRARAQLAAGRPRDAIETLRAEGLRLDDDAAYLREFGHLNLARALIAEQRLTRANGTLQPLLALLERLLIAARQQGRKRSTIEVLALRAMALNQLGQRSSALEDLRVATALAEPEGCLRPFLQHGPPMRQLLLDLDVSESQPLPFVRQMIGSFGRQENGAAASQQLVEPLSDRELEVLDLIAEGLTNRGIADRLYLSANTVKAHTRSIYGKLDVNTRTQAVARARELAILKP